MRKNITQQQTKPVDLLAVLESAKSNQLEKFNKDAQFGRYVLAAAYTKAIENARKKNANKSKTIKVNLPFEIIVAKPLVPMRDGEGKADGGTADGGTPKRETPVRVEVESTLKIGIPGFIEKEIKIKETFERNPDGGYGPQSNSEGGRGSGGGGVVRVYDSGRIRQN